MTGGRERARAFDYILVGGGLQSGLIALAVLADRPSARIAVIERASQLGGNHTWCFHEDDVPEAIEPALRPLVVASWGGYEVRFPGHHRSVGIPYAAVTSERFREVIADRIARAPRSAVFLQCAARAVSADRVTLDSGETLTGRLVVDARGPASGSDRAASGFQVFTGLELALATPHHLSRPVLMDARVPQDEGFRFFYALPLSPDRILLEDTYFADEPDLDGDLVRGRVLARAAELGFEVKAIAREERGVLPMPWANHLPRPPGSGEPLAAGYRGGWFHPATGYSFPVAARLAAFVAARSPERARREIAALARKHGRGARFAQGLNRLAFGFFAPSRRYHVFERFYRLPEATIRRFYSLELTARDKVRILGGRPPRGFSVRRPLARTKAERGA